MKVLELKKLLRGLPNDMDVIIPLNAGTGFDGMFFSPCIEESGELELGLDDLEEEEIKERELLNDPPATEKSFVLVPCGFFEEHEGPPIELN